jgi:WD40 repeat protein
VAIGFSNNGYHLATAHESAVVRAWDLRKQTTLKVLNEDKTMASVTSLSYDASGKYLAFGGKGGVQITTVKEWGTTGSIDVKNATGIVWCDNATVATCSDKERTVRFHGVE